MIQLSFRTTLLVLALAAIATVEARVGDGAISNDRELQVVAGMKPNATQAPVVLPAVTETPAVEWDATESNATLPIDTPAPTVPVVAGEGLLPDLVNVFPLGLCTGDCDYDSDCQEGLVCFQRSANDPVPGCKSGGMGFFASIDYCIIPPPTMAPTTAPLTAAPLTGAPLTAAPLTAAPMVNATPAPVAPAVTPVPVVTVVPAVAVMAGAP